MRLHRGLYSLPTIAAALLLILISFPSIVFAQPSHSIPELFRRAQSLERFGNRDQAANVYRDIWRLEANRVDAVIRGTDILEQRGRSDEAIIWMSEAVASTDVPNPLLWVAYGDLYDKIGREVSADSVWTLGVAAVDPPESVYLGVVDRLLLRSRIDRAVDWARQGLTEAEDATPFHRRLFDIELNRGNIANAATHAAQYVRNDPTHADEIQVALRHTELPPSARNTLADTLIAYSVREPNNAGITQLAAELALATNRREQALRLFMRAADLDERGMLVILANAQRVALLGYPEIAARLYRLVVERFPEAPSSPRAASLAANLFLSEGDDEAAEAMYRWLLNQGQSMYLDEAQLALGSIALRTNRPEEARQYYTNAVRNGRSVSVRRQAELGIAEIEVYQGRFAQAEAIWRRTTAQGLARDEATRAQLRLAEVAMYKGEATTHRELCDELLRQNPSADEANDCLVLTAILSEAKNDTAEWQRYGRLRYLFDTRRDDLFYSEIPTSENSVLSGRIALLRSRALVRDHRLEEAADSLRTIVSRFTGTPIGEEALWILGETLRVNHLDPVKALAAYEQLLREYPDTVYLGPARRAIRNLRDQLNPA